jgi:hypothetical protein
MWRRSSGGLLSSHTCCSQSRLFVFFWQSVMSALLDLARVDQRKEAVPDLTTWALFLLAIPVFLFAPLTVPLWSVGYCNCWSDPQQIVGGIYSLSLWQHNLGHIWQILPCNPVLRLLARLKSFHGLVERNKKHMLRFVVFVCLIGYKSTGK